MPNRKNFSVESVPNFKQYKGTLATYSINFKQEKQRNRDVAIK